MRWSAPIVATAIAAAVLGGCGGGDHQPEEAIGKTSQHVEKLHGELLLARAEYERAQFEEAPEEFAGDRAKQAAVRRETVLGADHLLAECHEGNGLESCTKLEAIEDVVHELDREARVR